MIAIQLWQIPHLQINDCHHYHNHHLFICS